MPTTSIQQHHRVRLPRDQGQTRLVPRQGPARNPDVFQNRKHCQLRAGALIRRMSYRSTPAAARRRGGARRGIARDPGAAPAAPLGPVGAVGGDAGGLLAGSVGRTAEEGAPTGSSACAIEGSGLGGCTGAPTATHGSGASKKSPTGATAAPPGGAGGTGPRGSPSGSGTPSSGAGMAIDARQPHDAFTKISATLLKKRPRGEGIKAGRHSFNADGLPLSPPRSLGTEGGEGDVL